MITVDQLKRRTVKDLAEMARKKKVPGWHSLRKEDLVKILAKKARQQSGSAARNGSSRAVGTQPTVAGKSFAAKPSRAATLPSVTVTNGAAKPHPATKAHVRSASKLVSGKVSLKVATAKSIVAKAPESPKSARNGTNGHSVNGHRPVVAVPSPAKSPGQVRTAPPPVSEPKVAAPRVRPRNPRVEQQLREAKARLAESKDLAFRNLDENGGPFRDRLVVMVRDPYWLHAYWELSRKSVDRARAAMGAYWHGARPVLRLTELTRDGTTTSARRVVRDIDIHGGVNNWYIDVPEPPKSYQLEIGYLSPDGGVFYPITRSNVVTTPAAGSGDAFDKNWADVAKDFDRIYAMSGGYDEQESGRELKEALEERLQRPMGDSSIGRFGPGAATGQPRPFNFEVDTELIVHGATEPGARVTLRGEPIPLRSDGTFAVRFKLPDRRHVLPVVASSGDGAEQRTIVLAVDRNTKVMEPVIRDAGD